MSSLTQSQAGNLPLPLLWMCTIFPHHSRRKMMHRLRLLQQTGVRGTPEAQEMLAGKEAAAMKTECSEPGTAATLGPK